MPLKFSKSFRDKWIKYRWIIFISVAFFIIMWMPYVFSTGTFTNIYFSDESAKIGDTIGGITAPFINLLAAILVYISFREQVKSNKLLRSENTYNFIQKRLEEFEKESYKSKKKIAESIQEIKNFVDSPEEMITLEKLGRVTTYLKRIPPIVDQLVLDKKLLFKLSDGVIEEAIKFNLLRKINKAGITLYEDMTFKNELQAFSVKADELLLKTQNATSSSKSEIDEIKNKVHSLTEGAARTVIDKSLNDCLQLNRKINEKTNQLMRKFDIELNEELHAHKLK